MGSWPRHVARQVPTFSNFDVLDDHVRPGFEPAGSFHERNVDAVALGLERIADGTRAGPGSTVVGSHDDEVAVI